MSSTIRNLLIATTIGVVLLVLYRPVERRLAAVQLLGAMQSEDRSRPPEPGTVIKTLKLPSGEPIRARVYGPSPGEARRSVVLAHGIHYRGIEEPRLIRFARHLASQGCRVLTPELSDLADYRITESGVDVLRVSVEAMAKESDSVGLIGFSFAGGLALLAATNSDTARDLDYVASVGGYHDLHRSLRFLATHEVEGPQGKSARTAHEYGLLVLLYGHLGEFELGQDHDPFRLALQAWLQEDRKRARAHAALLETEQARTLFQLIEKQRIPTLAQRVLGLLESHNVELARLSPKGKLATIETEVLFLHGSGDRVVPPEETMFAEAELEASGHPAHHAVVTPLLEHVRVDHPGSWQERWELVNLVAHLL